MQRIFIGIFAHPDDEAFGPAGTLLMQQYEGADIHLILLTNGEAGTNPDDAKQLGDVRRAEWRAAADILGATSTHALGLPDGELDHIPITHIQAQVAHYVAQIIASYPDPIEVSFITFEPHGLTGHRDHIVASDVATLLYETTNAASIWYFCLSEQQAPLSGTAYYEPHAREDSYITHKIDVSPFMEQKIAMMDAHYSQRHDAATQKALGAERLAVECFHVEYKSSFDQES